MTWNGVLLVRCRRSAGRLACLPIAAVVVGTPGQSPVCEDDASVVVRNPDAFLRSVQKLQTFLGRIKKRYLHYLRFVKCSPYRGAGSERPMAQESRMRPDINYGKSSPPQVFVNHGEGLTDKA